MLLLAGRLALSLLSPLFYLARRHVSKTWVPKSCGTSHANYKYPSATLLQSKVWVVVMMRLIIMVVPMVLWKQMNGSRECRSRLDGCPSHERCHFFVAAIVLWCGVRSVRTCLCGQGVTIVCTRCLKRNTSSRENGSRPERTVLNVNSSYWPWRGVIKATHQVGSWKKMDGCVCGDGVTRALIDSECRGKSLVRAACEGLGENVKCFDIQIINLECHGWMDGWVVVINNEGGALGAVQDKTSVCFVLKESKRLYTMPLSTKMHFILPKKIRGPPWHACREKQWVPRILG